MNENKSNVENVSKFKTFKVTSAHLDEYVWQLRDRNFFRCNEIAHNVALTNEDVKQKSDQVDILKLKFCEFLSMVHEIKECDKESADKINLWIDGNWDFLEKLKNKEG